MMNVKPSMYNENRCYIYNKAFYEAFFNPKHNADATPDRFDLIRFWAKDRGLYDKGNSHTQYVKLQEEAGELAKALLKNDKPEIYKKMPDHLNFIENIQREDGWFDNFMDYNKQLTGQIKKLILKMLMEELFGV